MNDRDLPNRMEIDEEPGEIAFRCDECHGPIFVGELYWPLAYGTVCNGCIGGIPVERLLGKYCGETPDIAEKPLYEE